jgi:uncharacterized membrane protein YbhN (UPF0104 family)
MLTLWIYPPGWPQFIAVFTVAAAVGIYMYGEQNDRITWMWSLAVIVIGIVLLPIFIIFEWLSVGRRDLWVEPDRHKHDELDTRGLPSKWNRKYEEDESKREYRPPEDPTL